MREGLSSFHVYKETARSAILQRFASDFTSGHPTLSIDCATFTLAPKLHPSATQGWHGRAPQLERLAGGESGLYVLGSHPPILGWLSPPSVPGVAPTRLSNQSDSSGQSEGGRVGRASVFGASDYLRLRSGLERGSTCTLFAEWKGCLPL